MSERPFEMQKLYDFLNPKAPIESLLDVGCHASGDYYAPHLRTIVKKYHGVDILPPGSEAEFLDDRAIGNFLSTAVAKSYEYVISISAIEHAGISTYKKADPRTERELIVHKIFTTATKGVFITFPFGKGKLEDDYECISFAELATWASMVGHFNVGTYYCADPNNCLGLDTAWYRIFIDDAKDKVYDKNVGTQTIGVLSCVFS